MIQDFEIIRILDLPNQGQYILARQLNVEHNFEVKEGTLLGGIPIVGYLDMPRVLDENQQPRLDVFVFRSLDRFPPDYFKEGQLVELFVPG